MCRCHVALQGRGEQGCAAQRLSFGMSDSGHSQRYLALRAFSAAAAAQVLSVLLPHLETTLPFRPAAHCQVATSFLHLSSQRKN